MNAPLKLDLYQCRNVTARISAYSPEQTGENFILRIRDDDKRLFEVCIGRAHRLEENPAHIVLRNIGIADRGRAA